MRGRKPTPTPVLKLRGSWRGNVRKDEPQLEAAVPAPAALLQGEALAEWNRVVAEMGPARVLTRADRGVLTAYCQQWARMLEAEAKVNELGAVLVTPNGAHQVNPWMSIARKAAELVHKFAIEFGMTPSSRARVKRVDEKKTKDGKERFFNSAS